MQIFVDQIVSVKKIGIQETIDIEVSGNNLFFANDILTHNSGFSNSDLSLTDTSECIYVNENVELRDGTLKKISDVCVGEQIKSQDDYKTVVMVHHKKQKDCIKIVTKFGKSIIVSKDHVFPTKNGRMSYNSGLKVGDFLNTME